MIKRLVVAISMLASTASFAADEPLYGGGTTTPNGTPEAAFTQGKAFASEMQSTVQGSFTEAKAKEAMEYDANPVEASYYDTTPPRDKGTEKQDYCANVDLSTLSERKRKECEAVNYLTETQGRSNPFVIDESTDPLFKRYEEGIELSKKISADTCSIEGSTVPGAGGYTEVCSEGIQRKESMCQENLNVTVETVRHKYTIEFVVTPLIGKQTSNRCEEDNGGGTIEFNLSTFTSFFDPSEKSNLWVPRAYSGILGGSWMQVDTIYHRRVKDSIVSLTSFLADNSRNCHVSPNMLTAFYIRPIYSQDMLNFLFNNGDQPKLQAETSFNNVVTTRILSVTLPPGLTPQPQADGHCSIGADVPHVSYTLSGAVYKNGPRYCFPNSESQNYTVLNQQQGIVSFNFGRFGGRDPVGRRSFNYAHDYSTTYYGMAYPRIVKIYIEKDAPKYTDTWDDQCKALKEAQ